MSDNLMKKVYNLINYEGYKIYYKSGEFFELKWNRTSPKCYEQKKRIKRHNFDYNLLINKPYR